MLAKNAYNRVVPLFEAEKQSLYRQLDGQINRVKKLEDKLQWAEASNKEERTLLDKFIALRQANQILDQKYSHLLSKNTLLRETPTPSYVEKKIIKAQAVVRGFFDRKKVNQMMKTEVVAFIEKNATNFKVIKDLVTLMADDKTKQAWQLMREIELSSRGAVTPHLLR